MSLDEESWDLGESLPVLISQESTVHSLLYIWMGMHLATCSVYLPLVYLSESKGGLTSPGQLNTPPLLPHTIFGNWALVRTLGLILQQ